MPQMGSWRTVVLKEANPNGYYRAHVWRLYGTTAHTFAFDQCETTAMKAAVLIVSGKRDSSPRLRLGLPRAFHVTPAFLTEGCPSGASGSLGRAVVTF